MINSRNKKRHNLRLHWRLFFPLVGLLWLIIGLTIGYFVSHEKQRQKFNLENRLLNVNNTVIDAYERGVDLQHTVEFIRLFTDNTTLAPLRITVYDKNGTMIADNPEATIAIFDEKGEPVSSLQPLICDSSYQNIVLDMDYDNKVSMISSKMSADSAIYSLAALPYEGEVINFLSIDPMIWIVIIILGVLSSTLTYLGVRAVSKNVYQLRDFAREIASDRLPDDIDKMDFSNDELGDVSRNLVTVYRDKINAEQEIARHERNVSMSIRHELNTPLGIIKGYVDTIVSDSSMSEEMRHKFLIRIQQNTDRLVNLVSDLNMLMRLQGNEGKLKDVEVIDFSKLASRIGEDIKQGHLTDSMTFDCNIPDGCKVLGHESLLTNVIHNLINNAVKHSGGTKMSLKWIRKEKGMHVFSFSDNGSGVPPEHIERLFDLFYRVDSGRSRKSGGTGLGLPLVKKIITVMGGEISVTNADSGGLQFTFSIPTES